ncbi:MAG TPA: FAD-dependent oxidoreductase [Oscillospiraceae bacterium]|nr:FAD-dependent oxidoreductase [Oscillospiraceae bacterium]
MKKKIVIIGGVAAGMSAAAKARRTDPDADIRVYTDGEHISYAGCGLPYFIGGKIASEEKLFARTVADFAEQDIAVKILSRAEEISPEKGTVRIRDLAGGMTYEDRYDRLILASGARSFAPPMEGADLEGVFSLRTVRDSLRIKTFLQTRRPREIAIIGGGYIALEMAENFVDLGCRVSIVERGSHIIPNMDEDMATVMQRYLESKGIAVHTGRAVRGFFGTQTVGGVHTDKGDIPADFVLLAIGVVPNSELAASAGIDLGVKNAIRVNERAETNLEGVYAAGDCATVTHLLTGKETYIPLGTTSNKQGKAAGENAAGGNAAFHGVIGTGIARAIEMEVSRTGLGEKECQAAGIAYVARRIKADTAAHYCPASREVYLKLIAEASGHRLLGAQIVGYEGAAMRIDMLATAITVGATVEQLLDMDLAYSPPFSPVWDPVLVALNQF